MTNQTLLETLASTEGHATAYELLEATVCDSVSPAICTNPGCGYTTDMEPDQDQGWCEHCATNTVKSALVLAGMI
ncbi:hypothetical protein [Palleronia caenipelagi]|uniref:Uncharacterized protein n=1 Tax=Palleronia caenipelagi TaxID=2489174 RepID=A0A547PNS3_9RHOB|nr:hypothetical protein [Palleronia caenipelagi]TRD15770.1 hypothetical protein FEV53_15020 [Palleronia caenipelagi]